RAFGAGVTGAGVGAAAVECTGTEAPAEAVRTGARGAACFVFAARSVLPLRTATCSFSCVDDAASAFEPLNQPSMSPAIVVGLSAGASPSFGCGAARGIGTLAIITGSLLPVATAGSCLTGASALAAGGVTVVVRGRAPGASET